MKLYIFNASPKASNSASEALIRDFVLLYNHEYEIIPLHSNTDPQIAISAFCDIYENLGNALFAFPVYLDGIPSHLLSVLCQIAERSQFMPRRAEPSKKPGIYSIVNCGFCDGHNAKYALEIMKNWSRRAGFSWKMGMGVGGCAGYSSSQSAPGHGIKRKIGSSMKKMIEILESEKENENIYTRTTYPEPIYRIGAHISFAAQARKNHVSLFHNQSAK